MKRKLDILLVTPGIMEIPPKSWGAIEKVIWNYKIQLEKLGHSVDIDVPWDFKKDYDIYHSHMANQSIYDLHSVAKKPYIFSLHDHHVYYKGLNSEISKQNFNAIKKSTISITHAEYLIDFFSDTDKLFYLTHGVDTNLYKDKNYIKDGHKLLCVAANGLIDNKSYDRKGLRFAIESAKELNLPITIVGPNKPYFDHNSDLLEYDKLNIVNSPNETELIEIYNNHTIFIHMSILEAGHPNLTILESLSCGLPIIGTYLGTDKLDGLVKCKRDTDDVVDKIKYVIDNYIDIKSKALETSKRYDWEIIVKNLEQIYYNVIDIKEKFNSGKMRNKIIDIYDNSPINHKEPNVPKTKMLIDYQNGPKVSISSPIDDVKYKIEFMDNDKIVHTTQLSNNQWTKANRRWYTEWVIKVTNLNGGYVNHIKFDIKQKNVYINMISDSIEHILNWLKSVEIFRKKHNCIIYCKTDFNYIFNSKFQNIEFVDSDFNKNNIYVTYDIGYSDDRNINPNGNTGENIAHDVLKL